MHEDGPINQLTRALMVFMSYINSETFTVLLVHLQPIQEYLIQCSDTFIEVPLCARPWASQDTKMDETREPASGFGAQTRGEEVTALPPVINVRGEGGAHPPRLHSPSARRHSHRLGINAHVLCRARPSACHALWAVPSLRQFHQLCLLSQQSSHSWCVHK